MFLRSAVLAASAFSSTALAAFGITTSGSNLIVDAGSDNPFKISVSTQSCDINSINYRSEEFQYKSKGSHISSGLGSATVKSEIISGMYNQILSSHRLTQLYFDQANMLRLPAPHLL